MCLNPKYAKYSSIYKPNGKRDIYFVGSEHRFEPDTLVIPCGKCDECKLDYAREWSVRCQCEASLWNDNWFVTCTYNDENLPIAKPAIVITDEYRDLAERMVENNDEFSTVEDYYPSFLKEAVDKNQCIYINELQPQHFTQFVKSVRQHWKREYNHDNIRFFGSGELGTSSLRPHYHFIFFNLPLYDLIPYKQVNGNQLFISKELSDIWHKGYVVIGKVTPESCGYVARYNYKKQIKGTSLYGVTPEFVRMSRRPGIGYQYFINNYEKLVETQFSVFLNGREYRNIAYFSRLMCGFDLDTLRNIKHYNEVDFEARDRSLVDYDLLHRRSQKTMKQKLLKKENISLDNSSLLLYNNRVKTSGDYSE